jgi:rhamnosyltransferase
MNSETANRVPDGVCAVIVTFRPDTAVETNLAAIRPQVDGMIVVDNTPPTCPVAWLRNACERFSIHFIENRSNLGLPSALNIGIARALQDGYRWVVLFDQDSTATEGMIGTMLDTYKQKSTSCNIGIVTPRYTNRVTKIVDPLSPPFVGDNMLDAAWTSGALIPASVLEEVGGFEGSLFMDLLDYDFSLRVRRAGYVIMLAENAFLLHEAGFPKTRWFLGVFPMRTDNHGPARRYYYARNRVWIVKKYHKHFPGLMRRNIARQAKELMWMLFCERNRWKLLTCIACGIKDGMTGRMGQTMEL